VRAFADGAGVVADAVGGYIEAVRAGAFPADGEAYE
jgi:ketopantoate hydroxymethyltransferase